MGPLLYSIFTNDLPSVLDKARVIMYADDSTMYSAALTYQELTDLLSIELRKEAEWISKN